MTDKIDIHNTDSIFSRTIQRIPEEFSEHNAELVRKFVEDCTIGMKMRKKVGKRRLMRYVWDLFLFAEFFENREFDKLTEDDFKQLYIALDSNKIKRDDGKPYAIQSKIDFVKTVKKFFKWLLGDNETFKQRVGWMIPSFGKLKDPPAALKREDIELLANNCKLRLKALLWFLFDSGVRPEEYCNVRLKHIIREKEKDYLKVRIEFSKTLPRTITIPMASPYVIQWLEQHPEKDNPEALLFPTTYRALQKFLEEIGEANINRSITPLLMRHSSITYYARMLKNPYKLNYRYGWATASRMAQQYIDREGLGEEETAEIIKIDEVSQLKKEIELMKEHNEIRKEADKIINALMEDKDIRELLLHKLKDQDLVKKVKMLV